MHQQALPFPVEGPVNGHWIENPFNVQLPIPAVPFAQTNPQLLWVVATTAAILVNQLQDNCRGGPVSIFAYNLFSHNFYNNQYFAAIVTDGSEFALQQLQIMQQGSDPQAVVGKAVQFYCGYAVAACATKFDLSPYLTQDMVNRINHTLQQWKNIQAPQQQQQAYGVPTGQIPGAARGAYGAADPAQYASANVGISTTAGIGALAYNPASVQDNSKFGAAAMQDTRPRPDSANTPEPELQALGVVESSGIGQPRAIPQARVTVERDVSGVIPQSQPVGVTVSSSIPEVSVLGNDDFNEEWMSKVKFDNDVDRKPDSEYHIPDTVTGRFLFRPMHVEVNLPTTLEEAELEEPEDLVTLDIESLVNGDDDWSILKLKNGSTAAMTTSKDTGRTWTMEQPHDHPYNPQSHFRYLVSEEDSADHCYEAFMAREKEVDYLDLEFNESKRAAARQVMLAGQNIMPDLSVLHSIVPRGVPYTIINALADLDKAESSANAEDHLAELEKFQGKLNFFERHKGPQEMHAVITKIEQFQQRVRARNAVAATCGYFIRSFVAEEMVKRVNAINSASIDKRVAIVLLMGDELLKCNPRAYLYLSTELTKVVNQALSAMLGITTFEITDFFVDYFDLCNEVSTSFSDEVFKQFGLAMSAALDSFSFGMDGSMLTVRQSYRLIGLPMALASFDLPSTNGDSYKVLSSLAPELYTIIRALIQDPETTKGARTYMHTVSGETFEVVESIWDEGYLTLLRS
jgi:hypothetical protein